MFYNYSGAGKTTLLSTIAKKIQPSCGSIKINGLDVSNIVMSQISSYMDQYNEISIDLTPREHLLFMVYICIYMFKLLLIIEKTNNRKA